MIQFSLNRNANLQEVQPDRQVSLMEGGNRLNLLTVFVALLVSFGDLPPTDIGYFDYKKKRFVGRFAWSFLDNYFLKRKDE